MNLHDLLPFEATLKTRRAKSEGRENSFSRDPSASASDDVNNTNRLETLATRPSKRCDHHAKLLTGVGALAALAVVGAAFAAMIPLFYRGYGRLRSAQKPKA